MNNLTVQTSLQGLAALAQRMHRGKGALLLLFLLQLGLSPVFAQDASPALNNSQGFGGRYAGDISFTGTLYIWAPLFNIDPSGQITKPNLSAGGGGDIAVSYYLSPTFGLGGFLDLGLTGVQNQKNQTNYLLAFSIGPRIVYDINIYTQRSGSHPFITIPLAFSIGISMAKYGNIFQVIPLLKPELGLYFSPFSTPEWGFGVSFQYWFYPEFTTQGLGRIGNYLMIGIGVTYHGGT